MAAKDFSIDLAPLGTYHSGIFAQGGAEIVAHDPDSQRLFVVNAQAVTLDILDISDPASPAKINTINASSFGGEVNSVAVHEGVVAAAIENVNKQDPGSVVFFDIDGNLLNSVTVGALPDMLIFTPDGKKVLVANEGEPLDYCQGGTENDPEGSVSIIDLKDGADELTQDDVANVGFSAFNDDDQLDPSIRTFGPNATVAQDFEPEYIAVSANSKQAWVTLQENNAIAVIDIRNAEVTKLIGLGFKDHSLSGSGIDASDRDGTVNIDNWPVNGVYMPDAIDAVKVGGKEYLVTANEGDAREYDCFVEEERVKDLDLDPTAFPDAGELQEDENIGRLTVTAMLGDNDDDGTYEELYALGTRSFSIWNEKGKPVFDSGEDLRDHGRCIP